MESAKLNSIKHILYYPIMEEQEIDITDFIGSTPNISVAKEFTQPHGEPQTCLHLHFVKQQ